jgi:hypothetical protein
MIIQLNISENFKTWVMDNQVNFQLLQYLITV